MSERRRSQRGSEEEDEGGCVGFGHKRPAGNAALPPKTTKPRPSLFQIFANQATSHRNTRKPHTAIGLIKHSLRTPMESLEHRGGSSRFPLCFRPYPMASSCEPNFARHHSADKVLTYIDVGDMDRRAAVVPAATSPWSDNIHNTSTQEFSTNRRKKRCFTRHISRAFKAALFHASLVKRMRSRKSEKIQPMPVNSQKCETFANLIRENLRSRESLEFQSGTDDRRTKSTSHSPRKSASAVPFSSPLMCTACSSSLTSKLRALSGHGGAPPEKKASIQHEPTCLSRKRSLYTGLCLLFVSLFALVIWGKICAIFCSSTWLLWLPPGDHGSLLPDHSKSPAINFANHRNTVAVDHLMQGKHGRNTHSESVSPSKFLM